MGVSEADIKLRFYGCDDNSGVGVEEGWCRGCGMEGGGEVEVRGVEGVRVEGGGGGGNVFGENPLERVELAMFCSST